LPWCMSDRDLCPGRGAARGTRSRHRRFTASALDAVCSAAGCGATYSGTAAARSDVRSAPERSAFPKTSRIACTEIIMAAEVKKQIALEIAHVLFTDIVGYSKLSINEQRAVVDELTQIVRATEQFQNAEAAARLIKIPTGDGMALVFYKSPEEPVECALEISRALKEHPRIQLRMGVHSGPVSGVIDVNGHVNLAGAGLNTAQRVMD